MLQKKSIFISAYPNGEEQKKKATERNEEKRLLFKESLQIDLLNLLLLQLLFHELRPPPHFKPALP